MNKLLIIDSYNIIFKAFYGFKYQNLTKDGKNIEAVFGFFKILQKLLKDHNPDYLVLAKEPTLKNQKSHNIRNDLFAEYKANRTSAPEELKDQFDIIFDGLKKSNIEVLSLINYEADDIIASLVKKFKNLDLEIKIISSDKDFVQILDKNVFLIKDSSKSRGVKILNSDEAYIEYGVKVYQFCTFQALLGDSIDNIPGVKGIGKKGASNLIKKFDTLENIYDNLDLIAPRQRNALITYKKQAFLSRKLAKLIDDLELNIELNDLNINNIDYDGMNTFFGEYNFNSLKENIKNLVPSNDLFLKKLKK